MGSFKKDKYSGQWRVTGPREVTVNEDGGKVFVYHFDEKLSEVTRSGGAHGTRLAK